MPLRRVTELSYRMFAGKGWVTDAEAIMDVNQWYGRGRREDASCTAANGTTHTQCHAMMLARAGHDCGRG